MPRRKGLLAALLTFGVAAASIGSALALTPTGSRDFAFIASSGNAIYSPISPFWLTWSHPLGLTLLAIGAGITGATAVALPLTRSRKDPAPTSAGNSH